MTLDQKILNQIQERKISRICHYTNHRFLYQILQSEDGILAAKWIDQRVYPPNDQNRYDGKRDYICCSIQYPNVWYLDSSRRRDNLFDEWVLLLIKPELAALDTTLFCPVNSAFGSGHYISGGTDGFLSLFRQNVQISRNISRSELMPANCATDGQAEVLIFKNIMRDDILGVVTENENLAERIVSAIHLLRCGTPSIPPIKIYIAPDLFQKSLYTRIRNGILPIQNLYQEV